MKYKTTWTAIRCENTIFLLVELQEKELFLKMRKLIVLLGVLLLVSCKQGGSEKQDEPDSTSKTSINEVLSVDHAEGFEIEQFEGYKTLTLKNAWPGAEKEFVYAVTNSENELPDDLYFDAIITLPVERIVVTSTTHIPSLEMLEEANALVGFPHANYISSEITRTRIDNGDVVELGANEDLNTELLIDLEPDAVITFAVDGANSSTATIQKTGIPVLYNADWTETTPLGKAEWIKFFGVLFQKEQKADSIFKSIESQYEEVKTLAEGVASKPAVLSGAMYKDVWYLPQGDSWAAQFIKDAHGMYLWGDTEGTGSLSLNLEAVLENGEAAQYWIGPGQFTSLSQLEEAHKVYTQFEAFKNGEVYSFTTLKGATGGVLYYELAPNRPDIVLKDIVKILHPSLLPNHELFFFTKLE